MLFFDRSFSSISIEKVLSFSNFSFASRILFIWSCNSNFFALIIALGFCVSRNFRFVSSSFTGYFDYRQGSSWVKLLSFYVMSSMEFAFTSSNSLFAFGFGFAASLPFFSSSLLRISAADLNIYYPSKGLHRLS